MCLSFRNILIINFKFECNTLKPYAFSWAWNEHELHIRIRNPVSGAFFLLFDMRQKKVPLFDQEIFFVWMFRSYGDFEWVFNLKGFEHEPILSALNHFIFSPTKVTDKPRPEVISEPNARSFTCGNYSSRHVCSTSHIPVNSNIKFHLDRICWTPESANLSHGQNYSSQAFCSTSTTLTKTEGK
jgi:hypothetical protein